MFEVICKKSHFLIQYVKLTIKICLVLHARPTRTLNQDPRSFLDSFRCTNSIAVLEFPNELPLKIVIFECDFALHFHPQIKKKKKIRKIIRL